MKALVGMSGGVDSSTAAYLLRKQGYDVVGLSLMLFQARGRSHPTACCSHEALVVASETARKIGFPHFVVDARDEFMEMVIKPFSESYASGLTPNPCVLCNRYVKFPVLLREAYSINADFIATGHYAKVDRAGGGPLLKRGIDAKKEQSYFLYALGPEELERLVLPLGPYKKEQVRRISEENGLPASAVPESQEICFIEDRDYAALICALNPEAVSPGPIKDMEGRTIGTHHGIHRYTLGQRRGLGISLPRPLYVVRIDLLENTIYVGPKEYTQTRSFLVGDIIMHSCLTEEFRAGVKIRSTMRPREAVVTRMGSERLKVVFDAPFDRPAPGQAAVFYDGDMVIGGGTILG